MLGVIESFLIFLHQVGILDNSVFAFLSALITFLFGYFTNKVKTKIEFTKPKKTNISGMDFEV
jgi:hypothetical protein